MIHELAGLLLLLTRIVYDTPVHTKMCPEYHMKKTLLIAVALLAALIFFYGAVSALVNQGHSLASSLTTFVLVGAGTATLIWFIKSGR